MVADVVVVDRAGLRGLGQMFLDGDRFDRGQPGVHADQPVLAFRAERHPAAFAGFGEHGGVPVRVDLPGQCPQPFAQGPDRQPGGDRQDAACTAPTCAWVVIVVSTSVISRTR